MIIVMDSGSNRKQVDFIIKKAQEMGFKTHPIIGEERTVIGIIGTKDISKIRMLEGLPKVHQVIPITKPFKLVGRDLYKTDAIIRVGPLQIGGNSRFVVMAGPCSVENRKQIMKTAEALHKAGATMIRGGAFKPRTSPYSFQGLGEDGLKMLAEARDRFGLRVVTEVMDTRQVELVCRYADVLQIGARNMQNFNLLREVGAVAKPVLIKRGLSATIEELLMAAEYIIAEGNNQIILCERGIRTFETMTRNTLDISAVPILKQLSRFPVIVDPSHAAGRRDILLPLCRAALAAGADGIMLEVHPNPTEAVSDGEQSLDLPQFANIMKELTPLATAMGRKI
jgi:3-deoxy-7-phosphoheptulonate synthase